MSLFELVAKLTLDSSQYESALSAAKGSAEKSGGNIVKSMDNARKGLTGAALGMGGAIAALGVMSVNTGREFDSSMSQVAATMGMTMDELQNQVGTVDTAYGEFTGNLRDYAKFMGENTAFSATEAADALNYMALAGYDAETSMQMLPNVLNLAAAGNMDLASASDMVTDAQSALGLSLEDTEGLVDKMAMASSKSNTSVAQLGDAILTVGGTAKNLAGGTTELSTALGILADNGIKGAEGGTALRNIILSLSAPTDQAAALMEELGLQVYDADGNMRPLNDTFNDLNSILDGMSQAEQTEVLNTLFNKVDLKSANALLANSGERFDELSGYIDEAQGSAQKMADTQLDNLEGDITLLKSAFEGFQLSISDKVSPIVRNFVQMLTGFLQNFDKYAPIIIGVAAAFGTLAVALNISSMIQTVKTSLSGLFLLLSANPFALVAAAIAGVVAAFVYLFKTNDEFRAKVLAIWAIVKTYFEKIRQFITTAVQAIHTYVVPILENMKKTWDTIVGAIKTLVDAGFKAIKKFIEDPIGSVKSFIESALKKIKQFIEDPIGTARDFVEGAFKKIQSFMEDPINAAKETIDSVVTAIKGFLEFTGLDTTVKKMWDSIKSKITKPITDAKDKVSDIVDTIKGFFPFTIGKIFTGIKLPVIHVDAGSPPYGLLGKGRKPSFDVSWPKTWNAKAMENPYLFTKATLFGAGEVGDEVLYGRENLLRDIKEATGSRGTTVNNYITVNGAENPEDWAQRFMKEMKREARMA